MPANNFAVKPTPGDPHRPDHRAVLGIPLKPLAYGVAEQETVSGVFFYRRGTVSGVRSHYAGISGTYPYP